MMKFAKAALLILAGGLPAVSATTACDVFICVVEDIGFLPTPDVDVIIPNGFIPTGFVNIGEIVGDSRRHERNLALEFQEEWLEQWGDFASEWTDFWLSSGVQGTATVYEPEDTTATERSNVPATYAISYGVDLPEECASGDCKFAVTDASECTPQAIQDSTGVAVTIPGPNGTVTFSEELQSNFGQGFFLGKTMIFGYGNGTAFACGMIEQAQYEVAVEDCPRLTDTYGSIQCVSEAVRLLTQCIVPNCPNVDQVCTFAEDADTCGEVEMICDKIGKDCCGGCGCEFANLMDCSTAGLCDPFDCTGDPNLGPGSRGLLSKVEDKLIFPPANDRNLLFEEIDAESCLLEATGEYTQCVLNKCPNYESACTVIEFDEDTCADAESTCTHLTKECCPECASEMATLMDCSLGELCEPFDCGSKATVQTDETDAAKDALGRDSLILASLAAAIAAAAVA